MALPGSANQFLNLMKCFQPHKCSVGPQCLFSTLQIMHLYSQCFAVSSNLDNFSEWDEMCASQVLFEAKAAICPLLARKTESSASFDGNGVNLRFSMPSALPHIPLRPFLR